MVGFSTQRLPASRPRTARGCSYPRVTLRADLNSSSWKIRNGQHRRSRAIHPDTSVNVIIAESSA